MRMTEWMKPGMHFKRWLALCLLGVTLMGASVMVLLQRVEIGPLSYVLALALLVGGALAIFVGAFFTVESLWRLMRPEKTMKSPKDLSDVLYEKRVLGRGPRIAVVGGGTGLSTLLRGLKHHTSNLTAIVTVADDGGSSGMLRDDLGIIPPGDIRNCVLALSNIEPIMERLFCQRFTEGSLKGQNFGNLFFAAMSDICNGSMEEAIQQVSNVLNVTGRVLPVTLADITLAAQLQNGETVYGESNIPEKVIEVKSPIDHVFLVPGDAQPVPEALEAILDADLIILGPGSLYTSVMPNLLIDGVVDAIRRAHAPCLYVCNVMTQPGETDGFAVSDHVSVLQKLVGPGVIDLVLANHNMSIPDAIRRRYQEDGAEVVIPDARECELLGTRMIARDMVRASEGYVRHSASALGEAVMGVWTDYINHTGPAVHIPTSGL